MTIQLLLNVVAPGSPVVTVQYDRGHPYHQLKFSWGARDTSGYFTLSELYELACNLMRYVERFEETTHEVESDVWLP